MAGCANVNSYGWRLLRGGLILLFWFDAVCKIDALKDVGEAGEAL